MKIFFDTNVLIAAFVSHGVCHELFEHCMTEHIVYSSDFVISELTEKLKKKFKYPEPEITLAKRIILAGTVITGEIRLKKRISRDKTDDHIIAAAINGKVDCIITGDKDLLVLKIVKHIPIIQPNDFWKFERDFRNRTI